MKITIINVGNFENSNEPEVLLYTPMLLDINNPFFEILLNTFDIFEDKSSFLQALKSNNEIKIKQHLEKILETSLYFKLYM